MLNRVLAVIFYGLFRIRAGHWLLPLLSAWVGAYQFMHGHQRPAYLWWALCLVIIALTVAARVLDYVRFEPVDLPGATLDEQQPPVLLRGVAAGMFEANDVSWLFVYTPVQVRWLEREGRAPVLAVLMPADLPADVRAPLVRATHRSIWYPGSQLEAGWIYTRWERHFGLRLRFLGRYLLVAVDEASARAIMSAFQRAEVGSK